MRAVAALDQGVTETARKDMRDYRPLYLRAVAAMWATRFLALFTFINLLVTGAMLITLNTSGDMRGFDVWLPGSITVYSFANIIAIIINGMWVYRADWMARYGGARELQSPGATVFGHAIPIVGLWLPYRGFRELYSIAIYGSEHQGGGSTSVVLRLWLVWIGSHVLSSVSAILFEPQTFQLALCLGIIADMLAFISALLFIQYVSVVTDGLETMGQGELAEEVFKN